jgi:Fic family protein
MSNPKRDIERIILDYIKENPLCQSKDIYKPVKRDIAFATLKRLLQKLITENLISVEGQGKSTKYLLSPGYELLHNINMNTYFKLELDKRKAKKDFNHELLSEVFVHTPLFTEGELQHLTNLQSQYRKNVSVLNNREYKKELERLAIDLSWKSSQIEGNTYSLLETERLLKEHAMSAGKTKEEATMLLNHKDALDFIIAHPAYVKKLSIRVIEDIHSILIKNLGVERNIRRRRVGISGTNYKPLDNEHQVKEALHDMCSLVNKEKNVFTKALLILVLISYIQPFLDGNKRTARIISNALLMHHGYCPLSFRTVDSLDYKKAMLIFYEQNNISAFKQIFIDQFEFAVKTYF